MCSEFKQISFLQDIGTNKGKVARIIDSIFKHIAQCVPSWNREEMPESTTTTFAAGWAIPLPFCRWRKLFDRIFEIKSNETEIIVQSIINRPCAGYDICVYLISELCIHGRALQRVPTKSSVSWKTQKYYKSAHLDWITVCKTECSLVSAGYAKQCKICRVHTKLWMVWTDLTSFSRLFGPKKCWQGKLSHIQNCNHFLYCQCYSIQSNTGNLQTIKRIIKFLIRQGN